MKLYHNKIKDIGYLFYRLISPIFDPLKMLNSFSGYGNFINDLQKYRHLECSETMGFQNLYPCFQDKSKNPFDSHYFYQDLWAFEKILNSKVETHVDVGSRVDFVGFLSTITKVIFIDIRPLEVSLSNLETRIGSVLSMPFDSQSIKSLSCLHVAEHIGLGRYGDTLNPHGTIQACKELSRILSPGGHLYFSVPVGKPKLCFNAHRIQSTEQILSYFDELELCEISGITDEGKMIKNIDISILEKSDYACGLFDFIRN